MTLLELGSRNRGTEIPNFFPYKKKNKESSEDAKFMEVEQVVIENYRPSLEISGATDILDVDIDSFYKTNKAEVIQFPNNLVADAYPEIKVKEAIAIYKKAVMGFFSFVTLAMVILTSFLVLGVTKTISIPVSIFGSFVSLAMVLGIMIEFKKWESKYD